MASIPLTVKNIVLSTPLAVAYGGTAVNSVTSVPTASSWAGWDTNRNLSANNVTEGYSTTVTAAFTLSMLAGSAFNQYFTGTSAQTLLLPITSTLVLGQSYNIVNNSSAPLTLQTSGSNTIVILPAGAQTIVTCTLTSGTTTASWAYNNNMIYLNTVMTTKINTYTRPTTFSGSGVSDSFNFSGLSSGSYWCSIITTSGGTVTTFFATYSSVSSTLYTGGIAGNNISVNVSGTSISWYSNNGVSCTGQFTYLCMT